MSGITRSRSLLLASGVLLLGSLAACGGGSDATATDSGSETGAGAASTAPSDGSSAGGAGGGAGFPGASGLVADVSGKTLQVQGQDGQTAVTYTDATTFTAQVSATLADVAVGSCVTVTPVSDSSSGTDSAATSVTAASVRITAAASDGSCTGGFGGGTGDGQRPSGAPSEMPSGMPTDVPSDFPTDGSMPSGGPGGGRGGFGASGAVSAVSETGFTLTQGDQTTEVTVSGDTTYTTTADATADAVKVGVCVTATGDADDTGAVTAERISVSDAVDGECTTGLGGRGGFDGAPSGGNA